MCSTDDGSKLSAGFGRLTNASFEWAVHYDEIILVLEVSVTAITETETLKAGCLDTIWLPAGTRVTYQAKDALIFNVTQPADRVQPDSVQGQPDHVDYLAAAAQRPDRRLEYEVRVEQMLKASCCSCGFFFISLKTGQL